MVGMKSSGGGQQLAVRQRSSFSSKFKRGAIITSLGVVVFGAVSVFLPFVPLTVALVSGGVVGGALANATEKK